MDGGAVKSTDSAMIAVEIIKTAVAPTAGAYKVLKLPLVIVPFTHVTAP